MKNEPLVTVGTITGIAAAALAVVVVFIVPLTDTQQNAILGLVAVLAPLIVAAIVRPQVTPEEKARAREAAARTAARRVDLDPPTGGAL